MTDTIRFKIIAFTIVSIVVTSISFYYISTWNYTKEISEQHHNLARETLATLKKTIQNEYDDILTYEISSIKQERQLLKSSLNAILSTVDSFYTLQNTGQLSVQQAKKLCIDQLKQYRQRNNQYIFVCNIDLIGISHPIEDMVGKTWTGFDDLKKRDTFKQIQARIATDKEIYMVFWWPQFNDKKQVKQIGFFRYVPEWDWIIGITREMSYIQETSQKKETASFNKIKNNLGQMIINKIGGIVIFDSHGDDIALTSNFNDIDTKQAAKKLIYAVKKEQERERRLTFRKTYQYHPESSEDPIQIAYIDYFDYMGYYLSVFIDKNSLDQPIRTIFIKQSLIFFLVLSLGVVFAVFISGKISSSITKLAEYAHTLPDTNFEEDPSNVLDSILANADNDETRRLTKAFIFMEDRLQDYIKLLKEHQKLLERRVAERTQDLSNTNAELEKEIKERKNAENTKKALIDQLKEKIDQINKLKGLLPICSNCKKIRDDKGYWNHLELFIEEHSDASFSHGMCPECSDKFYGDQDWYKDMKKKKGYE